MRLVPNINPLEKELCPFACDNTLDYSWQATCEICALHTMCNGN